MEPSAASERDLIAADQAFQQGDFQKAEYLCRKVLEQEPQHVLALHLLALSRLNQGDSDEAITLLESVVEREPSSFDALLHLSDLNREKGQLEKAIQFAQRSLQINPSSPEAYHALGLCCLSQQRLPQAAGCFQRAARLNPAQSIYVLHLGIANHAMGNFEAAKECYQASIKLDPKGSEPYIRLGLLFIGEGRRNEAIELLNQALAIEPNNSRAHVLLGQALHDEGRIEESDHHIRQAEINPKGQVPLGLALLEMGRFQEAQSVFERAIENDPRQPAAYQALTRSRRITDEDQPLLQKMQDIAQQGGLTHQDEGLLHFALGKALEDLKEYESAIRHFDRANELFATFLRLRFDAQKHVDYVDQLSGTFTKSFFERNTQLGCDSELPIFIVGMIRSGTTLVEQILSSHPDVGAAGEIRFWIEREAALATGLRDGSLNATSASQIAMDYRDRLRTLAPRSKRVTDKMPLNFMLLGLIHTICPKAKIVHCRRNALDNCLSIYTTHFVVSPEYAHNPANLVAYHREYQRLMDHWRNVLPSDQFLEVDYEELVANRELVTRKMIDYVGLRWDDACLHHEKNLRTVTTPSAWQVRQPIYTTSVERWRHFEPWLGLFRQLL